MDVQPIQSSGEIRESRLIVEGRGHLYGIQVTLGDRTSEVEIYDGEKMIYLSRSSHPGVWPTPILCKSGIAVKVIGKPSRYIVEYLPIPA